MGGGRPLVGYDIAAFAVLQTGDQFLGEGLVPRGGIEDLLVQKALGFLRDDAWEADADLTEGAIGAGTSGHVSLGQALQPFGGEHPVR
jgi:hypothetical protein